MVTQKNTTILTEPHYLGSIYHFAQLLAHPVVLFEQYGFFEKSTCRNRCFIAAGNGKLMLSIPLAGGRQQQGFLKEVQIDYSYNWQKNHWHGIQSAYRSSAYFMYYEDVFFPFYHQNYRFLTDFTIQLYTAIFQLLKTGTQIETTRQYQQQYNPQLVCDLRNQTGNCKNAAQLPAGFTQPIYHQLFAHKNGFLPNLSIIDLLFAQGPNTTALLQQCLS